jgi:4a-hydroxytetrahydrobiopterin dehydratase
MLRYKKDFGNSQIFKSSERSKKMTELSKMNCEACKPGSPLVTEAELKRHLPQIPQWQVVSAEGVNHLERTFSFKDFASALAFTNRVGALAEQEGHHPALLTEWGKVKVAWWTHAISGLHQNDLIMAARTDELYHPIP